MSHKISSINTAICGIQREPKTKLFFKHLQNYQQVETTHTTQLAFFAIFNSRDQLDMTVTGFNGFRCHRVIDHGTLH